jgi:AcrR family transcriptional regulator
VTTVKADGRRVTKRPDERRRDLLDAAVKVFAKKGVSAATVSDIAKAAGVAKGTFYLYYSSKEHLLGALKEQFVDEMMEHATSLYEQVGKEDWWALVDETVESFVDFILARRDQVHVLIQEGITPETSDIFSVAEQKIDIMFAAAIRAGNEAGAFRVADPELTGRLLHHALDGAMTHAVLYEQDIDRGRLVAAARELVHKTLAP